MEGYSLSDCELLIMKVIWQSENILSLQEIAELVNQEYDKNWKTQTVSVFLGRIVKKNILTSKRLGRHFFYYPTISEEEYLERETVRCVDILGDGHADIFFAALAKARNLTSEEKSRIRSILNDLD